MLRRSDFSELVRMFMKDLDEEISLTDAESVIRKTLMLHLGSDVDGEIQLTEPVTNSAAPDQIIKLGSHEQKAFSQLSVLA